MFPTATAATSNLATSTLRILVADDHELTRFLLRTTLQQQANVELVGLATNGQEAVELARRTHPDVVILDLQMPIMDGAIASHQIKALNPGIKIIGFSTLLGTQGQQLIEAAALDAFCEKSTEVADLLQVARQLTSHTSRSRP